MTLGFGPVEVATGHCHCSRRSLLSGGESTIGASWSPWNAPATRGAGVAFGGGDCVFFGALISLALVTPSLFKRAHRNQSPWSQRLARIEMMFESTGAAKY